MTVFYGGFWRRFVAISIDTIILHIFNLILFTIVICMVPLPHDFGTSRESVYTVYIPYYGMIILVNAAYFIYFHGMTGQTPGKKLLGLAVVRTDGEPMTFGIAFLRWVGYIISKLPLFLGFIWAAFDGRKQGWHDKIAGTCVIKTRIYQDIRYQPPPNAGFESPSGNPPEGERTYENRKPSGGYDAQKEAGSDGEST